MTSRTKAQIEAMKKPTIGCEIEMANITREKAIRTIAKQFGTGDTVNHDGGAYDAWSCRDTQNRVWKITRDSSIRARCDAEKTELATPILTYDDIETLQEVARQLRRAGGISNPRVGAGVHIHISAAGHTAQTLRNLANIMASHESLLVEALNIDAGRIASYCGMVDKRFLQRINETKPKTMAELADAWYANTSESRYAKYNTSRYKMLNYHAAFTKGTIEFRGYQFDNPTQGRKGGIHAGQLKAFIQLSLALCEMAKEVKTASPKPQQHENPKYAMRTWLLRLGFVGDEFATAREVLTQRLSGDAAFRGERTTA